MTLPPHPPEVSLRSATEDDLHFVSALARDPSVEPFLMPGAGDRGALRELITTQRREEDAHGLFVIASSEGERLGALTLQVINRRSRICELSRLMVGPRIRRTGVGAAAVAAACRHALSGLGLHRVQAEVYSDNVPAQTLFEHVGFVREGARRQAYWRRGRWIDGVLFGLLAEELPAE
jgi:RimJ/RimL family protein N-acetyltransferase